MLMTRLFHRLAAQTCGFNNHFQAGLMLLLNTLLETLLFNILCNCAQNQLIILWDISSQLVYPKVFRAAGKDCHDGNWNRKRLDTKKFSKEA